MNPDNPVRKSRVYIALLHSPMYNKRMERITTSVTNLDLHDIARSSRTYDVDGFIIVHPSESQRQLVNDILSYWQKGYGGVYNPDRREAFSGLRLVPSLEEAVAQLEAETGRAVKTIATDARLYPNSVSYARLKAKIREDEATYLILFGTGWGMVAELMNRCDFILEPLEAGRTYNHLSVRSAAAIILDRLLGESWFER
ncbi:MAG: RNA methyltransferase [Syntrophomonas sp.]